MSSKQKIATIEFTVIVLLWTLTVVLPLIFINDINQDWRSIHVMWVECAVVGIVFLINRFILMPRLFFTRKYSSYIISIILLFIVLAISVIYFNVINTILNLFVEGYPDIETFQMTRNLPFRRPPVPHNHTLIPPMYEVIILSAIVVALDMGMSIAIRWIISEQKQSEIEKQRVKAQLSNLQSQISPHFFMNTLNNIHALVDVDSVRAKQTIIELSGLMDYLIYDADKLELVSLQRELDFINNYINLMRIRFPEEVRVSISYNGSVPVVKIPPLLFLNFIENAFKYGVDSELESYIDIEFSFCNDTIKVVVINSNHSENVKRDRGGVGISNSRKRLGLLYGNRYTLDIIEDKNQYTVNLEIPII